MPTKLVPPLTEAEKESFESIKLAVEQNELALVRTTEKATERPVALLCKVIVDPEGGDDYLIFPVARLLDDDEFETLNAP
jgi:hypothetical protein